MTDIENAEEGIVERIDPLAVPTGILSIHEARYRFAAPLCENLVVLDMACGAGYGSAILAERARAVVGGDIDTGAVEFGRKHYSLENLRLEVMDALKIPAQAGQFQAVVSFETIEHVSDASRFLEEVARVMTDDGIFIVSTPAVPVTDSSPRNPHHVIEWAPADFRELLSQRFSSVELFGQSRAQTTRHRWLQRLDVLGIRHRVPSVVRRGATRALGTTPFEEMTVDNQRIVRGDLRRAEYVIAVCSGAV